MLEFRKFLTYVILVFFALLSVWPFYWITKTSLEAGGNVYKYPPNLFPHPITFSNYVGAWKTVNLGGYYLNTLIIAGLGTFLNVLFSLMVAYPLARIDFKGKQFVLFLVLLPMMIPVQNTLIVNYLTLRKLGMLNTYLGVVLPQAVTIFGIFMMRQAYLNIPKSFEDAARIDGAGELYIWWRIITPLIKPDIATLVVFQVITWWDNFLWPLIVLSDSNKYPLAVALVYLNSTFQVNFRYTAAGIVLSILPVIILFLVAQRYIINAIAGGVKY
ncbi:MULTISPECIES: carbohydrate ABC transporter permease [Thermotoga]|uniref:Sugar ABC transporter, permease protein n=1 Tax=Thermotoga neapolitana (strain ATCC 49049 / DSM 4359 / NBRC 107923 / NS-E) TaxID=309803 RepID=B9KAF8_THENN|nr:MULTISPECIES: carbohydrate ABC transporter permease [Thermotoga]ACM23941.1 Sugar ABC transporter, permease protein [Thermotoga neapolitana DSM 4359]AJG39968.1 sugar ABC transporter permease [Thermotoga sp. RQ7]KFZ20986.1 sugar ABC transporter permease [Thermotoga neapolitana LA10]HBF10649.1 carbohydrate ABC transporter permease [Thermotoga neapolitana]